MFNTQINSRVIYKILQSLIKAQIQIIYIYNILRIKLDSRQFIISFMQEYLQKNIKQEVKQIIYMQNRSKKVVEQNQKFNSKIYSFLSDTKCLNLSRMKCNFISKINVINNQINLPTNPHKQCNVINTQNINLKSSIHHQINYDDNKKQHNTLTVAQTSQNMPSKTVDLKETFKQKQASRVTSFSNIQNQEIILQVPQTIQLKQRQHFEANQTNNLSQIKISSIPLQSTPKKQKKQNKQTKNKCVYSSQKRRSYALNPSPQISVHVSINKNKKMGDSTQKISKDLTSKQKRRKFIDVFCSHTNQVNISNSAFTTEQL